jgi:hypothetical protein
LIEKRLDLLQGRKEPVYPESNTLGLVVETPHFVAVICDELAAFDTEWNETCRAGRDGEWVYHPVELPAWERETGRKGKKRKEGKSEEKTTVMLNEQHSAQSQTMHQIQPPLKRIYSV